MRKLNDLPRSDDTEFWGEEAYRHRSKPIKFPICKTHSKSGWMKHRGYVDNGDGTAVCPDCGWGFRIPGYMRVYNGRVVDLRTSKT